MSGNPVCRASTAAMRAALAVGGVSVQYSQGGSPTTLDAVPGRTDFMPAGDLGQLFALAKPRDWMVRAADLPGPPGAGDTITYDSKLYDLVPAGHWRWYHAADPNQTIYRLHTLYLDLAHTVTVQQFVETGKDTRGQRSGGWEDELSDLVAAVVPVGSLNMEAAHAVWDKATHRVFGRYNADITVKKRLTYDGRTLEIGHVTDIAEMGLFMVLDCVE